MSPTTLILALTLVLSGCSGLDPALTKTVDTVKTLHDKQLAAGEAAVCGASLRSLVSEYGADAGRLQGLLVYCQYDTYFTNLAADPTKELE